MSSGPELPSGTVSFLFTDIEGSTSLLEQLGERCAEAPAEHQRILREAFAAHGGHEIDTPGDAFSAFRRAKGGRDRVPGSARWRSTKAGRNRAAHAHGASQPSAASAPSAWDAGCRERPADRRSQNPSAAATAWQRAEDAILAATPLVPSYDRQTADLVSRRVGNYELNPQWGVLLDQLGSGNGV